MDKSWAIVEMKDVQEPWILPLGGVRGNGSSLSLPPAATNRFLASSYRSASVVGVRRRKLTKTEDDNANMASNMYKRGSSGCFILPLEWSEV